MKSTFILVALMSLCAGAARANLTNLFGDTAAKAPPAVTFDPKTIKAGDTADSIKTAFKDSVASETVDPKTGNKIVTLRNVGEGNAAAYSGRDPEKITQITTLMLVVDKDGKVASYDMVQELWTGSGSSSRSLGAACFSSCENSAKAIVDANAAAKAKSNPPSSVASVVGHGGGGGGGGYGNAQQEVSESVSPSAP